jgi:hypothetical protein
LSSVMLSIVALIVFNVNVDIEHGRSVERR